jgi:hypothetical protein
MAMTSRPWDGAGDLRLMQDLVSASWLAQRPLVNCTAGDLEWWLTNNPSAASPETVRLWFDDSELAGWAWLEPPASLDWHLRADLRGGPVHDELLDWLAARAGEAIAGGQRLERLRVWVMDADTATRSLLAERGYRAGTTTLRHWIHQPGGSAATGRPERLSGAPRALAG